MITSLTALQELLSNSFLLLCIKTTAFFVKGYILSVVLKNLATTETAKKLWILIAITIGSMLIIDAQWITVLLNNTNLVTINPTSIILFTRFICPFIILQYFGFLLFLHHLIRKTIRPYFKPYYILSVLALCSILGLFVYELTHLNTPTSNIPAAKLYYPILYFYIMLVIAPAIFTVIIIIRRAQLPKILNHQLHILINYLIAPHLFLELITANPFTHFTNTPYRSNYMLISIGTIQLTYAMYYCARKMIQLRFLNSKKRVISKNNFDFIKDFKEILDQLSHIVSINELSHITQNFFKSAFNIPFNKIKLHTRIFEKLDPTHVFSESSDTLRIYIEEFLSKHDSSDIKQYIYNAKILIKDEIEFSNFYDENSNQALILEFLTTIHASVFLPIYEKQALIGYIIIENEARKNLFTNVDQDEMVVFAGYLANTINIMRTSTINQLIKSNKELTEELYNKHQEIQQYKESIRSFLKVTNDRKIGILFYRNRKFNYGNQAAQELLPLDINQEDGTSLVQSLKRLARDVLEYKSSQSLATKDPAGNRLMISAIPSLEENYIILTVYYPEITDIIKLQRDLLKDPSSWDYLLYLETTKSGQLINQLIPGSGEMLLNFKINLLRMALSKKALLLEMAQEDLIPAVETLHHISLRTKLHVLSLTQPEKNFETAFKLFGANPLFGNEYQEPLLEKLNNTGTLFIENIHFLNFETQEYLAQFLAYGFFHVFKSDKKIFSNVRIICSTNKNIQEGAFSKNLLQELEKMVLTLPPLITLPHNELNELADRFVEQLVPTTAISNMLFLSDKEKEQLINQNPISITEFKELVHKKVLTKSSTNNIYHESSFNPGITNPELARAIRLGKKALKDPATMTLLWNTFKSQSKIANLLGVNRSSVNRRQKEYLLMDEKNSNI